MANKIKQKASPKTRAAKQAIKISKTTRRTSATLRQSLKQRVPDAVHTSFLTQKFPFLTGLALTIQENFDLKIGTKDDWPNRQRKVNRLQINQKVPALIGFTNKTSQGALDLCFRASVSGQYVIFHLDFIHPDRYIFDPVATSQNYKKNGEFLKSSSPTAIVAVLMDQFCNNYTATVDPIQDNPKFSSILAKQQGGNLENEVDFYYLLGA